MKHIANALCIILRKRKPAITVAASQRTWTGDENPCPHFLNKTHANVDQRSYTIRLFSVHTTNLILTKVKCKNKLKRQHFFHNRLCAATEMGNALPVFTKHNWLSCVACWAGRIENQECFSNGVNSTAYMRWNCTVYDFLTLSRICEHEVMLLMSCWLDDVTVGFEFLNVCYFIIKEIVSAPVAPYVTCDENVRPSF